MGTDEVQRPRWLVAFQIAGMVLLVAAVMWVAGEPGAAVGIGVGAGVVGAVGLVGWVTERGA